MSGERDALAEVLWAAEKKHNGNTFAEEPFRATYRAQADAVLAAGYSAQGEGDAAVRAAIEARHREEWAAYFESWDGAVGPEPLTVSRVIAALRWKSVPFGCSQATHTEARP